MRNNNIQWLLALVVLAFASCTKHEEVHIEDNEPPITVTLSNVQTNTEAPSFSATGKLVSAKSSNVSTRVMGYITNFNKKVGDRVSKGQHIATINSADIDAKGGQVDAQIGQVEAQIGQVDAQIAQAQANYDNAKKDLERFQNLYNKNSASAKELENMQTRFDVAKAGLEAAKQAKKTAIKGKEMAQQMKREVDAQYTYINVTAPISGIITNSFVEQGEMASPGMPLVTIESINNLQAQLMIPEANISQVKEGMEVNITLKSTGNVIQGKIDEINYSAEHTGGQYIVKVKIPYSKELLPGMYVNANIPIAENAKVVPTSNYVTVNKEALVHHGQLTGVYTVSESGTAILRWIKTGNINDGEVEVLSGLNADEAYITSATGKLYNGVKVQIN